VVEAGLDGVLDGVGRVLQGTWVSGVLIGEDGVMREADLAEQSRPGAEREEGQLLGVDVMSTRGRTKNGDCMPCCRR
jgi:hypothetical protein